MRTLIWMLLTLCLSLLPSKAQAAWPDKSKARVEAIKLFRLDIISSIALLAGEKRAAKYNRICKMKPKPYYPACEYKEWTGEDNRSIPSKAGEFFEIRCKNKYKEPLSCVVSGWSKGFVAGHPSNSGTDPEGAVEDFRYGCEERNYGPACAHLGDMYAAGVGVKRDGVKAKKLYEEACKAKDSYGCYRMGHLYLKGIGVEPNQLQALRRFEQGCKDQHIQACVDLADLYERGIGVAKDLSYTISLLDKACEAKHGEACYNLARLNLSGFGISSEQVAFGVYATLCGRGDHRSCYGLAKLYAKGRVVPQNVEMATTYFEQSCGGRFAPACSEMGLLKLDESSPFANPIEGVKLLQKSCAGDDPRGCVFLASLLETGQYVEFNAQQAVELYMKTCSKKQGLGCRAMGRLYSEGTIIRKNERKAKEYYELGCDELYDGGSCAALGVKYLKGDGLKQNNNEGLSYLARGCDLKDEQSCRLLGDIYAYGNFVVRNNRKALDLYISACNLDDTKSCYQAATLLSEGQIEHTIKEESVPYFELACRGGIDRACDEIKPLLFQYKFQKLVESSFKSKRCRIWNLNDAEPTLSRTVATANGDNFEILVGENKGSYSALPQGTSFEIDSLDSYGHSYWALISSKGKQYNFTHHENWNAKEIPDPARGFPPDTSYIYTTKGLPGIVYSRENEVLRKENIRKGCKLVLKSKELGTENCSSVQAILAAQLLSECD